MSDSENVTSAEVIAKQLHCQVDMVLPPGRTCSDCLRYRYCERHFGCKPESRSCDWSPSRFTEIPIVPAPSGGGKE